MEKWLFYLGIVLVLAGLTLGLLAVAEIFFKPGILDRPVFVPALASALMGTMLLRNSKRKKSKEGE